MLPFLFRKLAHLFSKDQSPEGLNKLDVDIERDITGLNFLVIIKGVGGILAGIAILYFIIWIVVTLMR